MNTHIVIILARLRCCTPRLRVLVGSGHVSRFRVAPCPPLWSLTWLGAPRFDPFLSPWWVWVLW